MELHEFIKNLTDENQQRLNSLRDRQATMTDITEIYDRQTIIDMLLDFAGGYGDPDKVTIELKNNTLVNPEKMMTEISDNEFLRDYRVNDEDSYWDVELRKYFNITTS